MEDFLGEGHIPTTHGMMRNSFYEDRSSNQYLVSGARNNEEMKLWTYTLSKGKRYILPEYLHVYRNVDREGMSNYNSTHTIFDMFKDNYIDLCIKIINLVPQNIAIERFLASSPPEKVVMPKWGLKNYEFTNMLNKRLRSGKD